MSKAFNHFLAAINPIGDSIGYYTAYEVSRQEHVGTYDGSIDELRDMLEGEGYQKHNLAAAKFHPEPHDAVDHLSLRKIPDSHPDILVDLESDRPRLVREFEPVQCQYHKHLWPVTDGIEVYSHYEIRGDIHPSGAEGSVMELIERGLEHYRPTWNYDDNPRSEWTYIRGLSDVEF